MDWVIDHAEIIFAIFYLAEKIVHISKSKWDDILVDGLKYIFTKFLNLISKL